MPTAKKKIKKKRKPSFTLPKSPPRPNYAQRPSPYFQNGAPIVGTWNTAFRTSTSKNVRATSHHSRGDRMSMNLNRLMHLNNRVVAKLNMLEINRWAQHTQYQQQVNENKVDFSDVIALISIS